MYSCLIDSAIFFIMVAFSAKLGSTLPNSSESCAASLSNSTDFSYYFKLKYTLECLSKNSTYIGSFILEVYDINCLYISIYFKPNYLSIIPDAISAKWNTSCKCMTFNIGGLLGSNFLTLRIYSHFFIFSSASSFSPALECTLAISE